MNEALGLDGLNDGTRLGVCRVDSVDGRHFWLFDACCGGGSLDRVCVVFKPLKNDEASIPFMFSSQCTIIHFVLLTKTRDSQHE
jgi:hypothetical protein